MCTERYDIVSMLREKKSLFHLFLFFSRNVHPEQKSLFVEFLVTMKSQPAHSRPPLHVPDGYSKLNLGLWEFLRVTLCIQFLGYCGKDLQPSRFPSSEGSGLTST